MNMLYYISTWWRWLRRSGYCRGFGVQSPSAYSFIRYVINEHTPYYAYADLRERLDMLSRRQHKLGRLLFRLSNYWQPAARFSDAVEYLPYMYAGCHKSLVLTLADIQEYLSHNPSDKIMIVVDMKEVDAEDRITHLLPLCHTQTMLVLLNLNKRKRGFWNAVQASSFTGITYHLYYVGIVYFDKDRFKQHYEVNF